MVSRGGRQVAAPNSRVARSTRFIFMKIAIKRPRKKLDVQTKKVLLDFFQKIVGSRGNALGAPRKARNTFAYMKRRMG